MLNEIILTTRISLNREEIIIAMLSIYGFCQKNMHAVTGFSIYRIKQIIRVLCVKLHGENSGNMAFHAQKAGFKLDGTFNGEDIFSDEWKRKIKAIDPDVEFRCREGSRERKRKQG